MRSPCTAMKSSPRSLQLEKAHVQQRRPNTAKNKWINIWPVSSVGHDWSFPSLWNSFSMWLPGHHTLLVFFLPPSNSFSDCLLDPLLPSGLTCWAVPGFCLGPLLPTLTLLVAFNSGFKYPLSVDPLQFWPDSSVSDSYYPTTHLASPLRYPIGILKLTRSSFVCSSPQFCSSYSLPRPWEVIIPQCTQATTLRVNLDPSPCLHWHWVLQQTLSTLPSVYLEAVRCFAPPSPRWL